MALRVAHANRRSDTSLVHLLAKGIAERGLTVPTLVAEWDKNKDGQISKIEFKQAVRNTLSISATNSEIDDLFREMDTDGGGTLDLAELRSAIKIMNDVFRRAEAEEAACLKRIDSCEHMARNLDLVIAVTEDSEAAEKELQHSATYPPLMARVGQTLRAQLSRAKGTTMRDMVVKWLGDAQMTGLC